MAISLKHAFNSGKSDGVDATLVQPSNWNAEHTLQLATGKLVGRTTASTGAAEEIAVSGDLLLSSGTLGINTSVATLTDTQTLTNKTLTSPTIATPTITTSATVPAVIGGTAVSSALTLQSTSGVGTSDSIALKVGNNGATTAMTINTSGEIGIGTTSQSGNTIRVSKNLTSSTTNAFGIQLDGQIQSSITGAAFYFASNASAASGTLGELHHFRAFQSGLGTATFTKQYGFNARSSLIGATNNYGHFADDTAAVTAGKTAYGFYSGINTATGGGTTYGFYAAGTAPNYFGGTVTSATSTTTPLLIGGTTASSSLTLQSTSGVGTSDSIAFKVGNNGATTAMTANTSGNIEFRAGTAALPAITTTGDTNTGIFFPAADTIAFTEGGAEAMRIDSSGNVGIGTTTPSTKLHVAGELTLGPVSTEGGQVTFHNPDASTGLVIDVSAANNARIFNTTNNFNLQIGQIVGTGGTIDFYTNATSRAVINSSGDFAFNSGYGSAARAYGCRAGCKLFNSIDPNATSRRNKRINSN